MKPKLWDGPNPVGEAKARFNETLATPFQTAVGPGFTARKMNGFSEVTGTEERDGPELVEPIFYCVGSLGTYSSQYPLAVSYNGKGTFKHRGRITLFDELLTDPNDLVALTLAHILQHIRYFGAGVGAMPVYLGGDTWTFATTKDFKRFRHTQTDFYLPSYQNFSVLAMLSPPAVRGGRKSTRTWGIHGAVMVDSFLREVFVFVENDVWAQGATQYVPGTHSGFKEVSRVSPTRLVACTWVEYTSTYDAEGNLISVNADGAPYPFFQMSNDNGGTWSVIPVPMTDFAKEANLTGVSMEMSRQFRAWAYSPTVYVGILPYSKHVAYDPDGYEVDQVLEYRAFRFTDSAVVQVAVLNKAIVDPDKGWFVNVESGICNPGPAGAIVAQWAPNPYHMDNHVLAISIDAGASWTYRTLGWASYHTGYVHWLDEKTLVCCVYDSGFFWFESVDLGGTWAKRATISDTIVDMSPTGDAYDHPYKNIMPSFNRVVQLRKQDGTPAHITPGAPWVSDPSIVYEAP